MSKSFSINPTLTSSALDKVTSELEDLNARIQEISQKALVGQIPLVHSILTSLNPTPEECKMLSKVFDRLSVLMVTRNELIQKNSALTAIRDQQNWIYESIGDPTRDVDTLLKDILSEPKESEPS